jgi:hypothetical protein
MERDLGEVVPERRPNQGADTAVVTSGTFARDAAIRAHILAHLAVVPAFPGPPAGSTVTPTQPGNRKLLDTACDAFVRMRDAALADGVALIVGAGWRSQETAEANAAASANSHAVASFSSHTLGLAMDLNLGAPGTTEHRTAPMPGVMAMRSTDPYRWMLLRAQEHGWYPWHAEPWHWEYNPSGFRDAFLAAAHAPPGTPIAADTHPDGGPTG